jgi:hypothetical protein
MTPSNSSVNVTNLPQPPGVGATPHRSKHQSMTASIVHVAADIVHVAAGMVHVAASMAHVAAGMVHVAAGMVHVPTGMVHITNRTPRACDPG